MDNKELLRSIEASEIGRIAKLIHKEDEYLAKIDLDTPAMKVAKKNVLDALNSMVAARNNIAGMITALSVTIASEAEFDAHRFDDEREKNPEPPEQALERGVGR